MNHDQITRTLIETLVDRYLKEMAEDPNRSLRKLVDMGGQFAKGRFQKLFFSTIQTMLEQEDSPYYTLVCQAVENIDHLNLRTFGVNMGFNSWTSGARTIRRQEETCGYNIPWSITLHLRGTKLPIKRIEALIKEGMNSGIYTYMLHSDDLALFRHLSYRYSSCAFLCFVQPEAITKERMTKLSGCSNVAVFLSTDSPWQDAAKLLRHYRRLYGAYTLCSSNEQAVRITDGVWLESLLGHGFVAACCITSEDAAETHEPLLSYLDHIRISQQYPLLPFAYYADSLRIDRIISDGPCFLGILPDGKVTTYSNGHEEPTGQNIVGTTLKKVLAGHCPR